MMELVSPPIRLDLFVGQECADSEWWRRSAGGVNYARGKHGGYDFQGDDDEQGRTLFSVLRRARVTEVDFGPALGIQTALRPIIAGQTKDDAAFYAHQARRLVRDGEIVEEGEPIGIMGNTSSYNITTHLHFETLDVFTSWYTTYNCGPQLRALKGDLMKQLDRIEAKVDRMRNIIEQELGQLVESVGTEVRKVGIEENKPLVQKLGNRVAAVGKATREDGQN